MSEPKRVRRDPAVARKLILDTTEQVMLQEGYAAVTTRRVAKEAGVNVALVHYYFPTTDDLFIAVHERLAEDQEAELNRLIAEEASLGAIWTFESRWPRAALGMEFAALANHRKSIREEIRRRVEAVRAVQLEAIASRLGSSALGAQCISTLMVSVSRALLNEEALGLTAGHAEVRELVGWLLSDLPAIERLWAERKTS
jgi:AcrR family transcriptional regulator